MIVQFLEQSKSSGVIVPVTVVWPPSTLHHDVVVDVFVYMRLPIDHRHLIRILGEELLVVDGGSSSVRSSPMRVLMKSGCGCSG
jgi:hypothetical protein